MSGLVAIFNLDGAPVDRDLLGRMTDFLAFRGPDAQEIWIEGAVGFGHTMLRTTWEAEFEWQPFTLDQQVWIVADARIDDREVLAEKLEIPFVPLRQKGTAGEKIVTDVEFILRSYLKWGEECVHHLLGDFVFVIWDGRQKRLFGARDQFGVKLFYYSQIGNCLIISNTLNCIRQHPRVSNKLNEAAIGDFLLFWMNYNFETTTFVDIQRLPSAHTFSYSAEAGLQTQLYWTLPIPDLIRYKRSEDYIDHFSEMMGKAVDDRLRTREIASLLSGGLDSTTIAATALKGAEQTMQQLNLKAFTIVYDSLIPDQERYYSGLVANALEIPIDYQAADNYYPYQRWDTPEFQLPEPTHNPFSVIHFERMQRVASHSRVALSGDGGDEALVGATVREMLHTMPFSAVVADVYRSWFQYHVAPPWGSGVVAALRSWLKKADKDTYPHWINPSFARRLSLKDRWQEVRGSKQKQPLTSARSRAYGRCSSSLWVPHLEQSDPQFCGIPVEIRYPFIDLRLLGYLLALPPLPWCVSKKLLRLAMSYTLPQEVCLRPKTLLAADPLLVKGTKVYQEPLWRLLSYVEGYICMDQLRGDNDAEGVWQRWHSLSPVSLAYWLVTSYHAIESRSDTQVNV